MDGIAVTGRGVVSVPPDKAVVSAGVSVLERKAQDARTRAADALQAIVGVLDRHDVADADRRTGVLRVAPEYDYKDGSQKLRGYRVTNTIAITVRALDALPALVDDLLAVSGDVAVIHGIEFDVQDRRAIEVRALEAAVADATLRAEGLARAAGLTLGAVTSVDAREREGGLPPPRMALMTERSQTATPIEAGSIEIEAVADVAFAIT